MKPCVKRKLYMFVLLSRVALVPQVDEEMKELREHFQRRKEGEGEEAESGQIKTLQLEMMKKMDAAEELGDGCIRAATVVTRNRDRAKKRLRKMLFCYIYLWRTQGVKHRQVLVFTFVFFFHFLFFFFSGYQ